MPRRIGFVTLISALSLVFTMTAGANSGNHYSTSTHHSGGTHTWSKNNGGNTPSCGASCDQSHNPKDYEKPCASVPGNGCHQLPNTPCERGHGGTEIGNKHCGTRKPCPKKPGLTILKEQSTSPSTGFTHDLLTAPLSRDIFYQVTVTNMTNTAYTLQASDPLCNDQFAHPLNPSGPQTLPALGTFVYTCDIDAIPGADDIPTGATAGEGPYTLTNTVTVVATPVGGGTPVTLTDTVSASLD
jgi:hypothetical protein